ncbi:MAG TPA: hypothetical protein VFK07_01300 [Candidatus Paceibacterota bacterium]|nr:hypothetical protein [Candidatus Paceibacterota bacterium]
MNFYIDSLAVSDIVAGGGSMPGRKANIPVLKCLKGLSIEEIFVEHQLSGQSPHIVIKARNHAEVRIIPVRRSASYPSGIKIESEGHESLLL